MSNNRTHFVTTSDAVTIGATVTGQCPSLVFLQGILGDGDLDWLSVLPHLTGRFTCHLPSLGAVASAAITPTSASGGSSRTSLPMSTASSLQPDWLAGPPVPAWHVRRSAFGRRRRGIRG